MKIVNQQVNLKFEPEKDIIQRLEKIARTCYASEELITDASGDKLIKKLLKSKHESIFEHATLTFEITTNRKIANQIVRHRTGKFAQRSLRYVNELKKNEDISFLFDISKVKEKSDIFKVNVLLTDIEDLYRNISSKYGSELAGQLLPLCTLTKIDATFDLRNLRHFFELRCNKKCEPLMEKLAKDMLKIAYQKLPIIFEDLYEKFIEKPDRRLLVSNT